MDDEAEADVGGGRGGGKVGGGGERAGGGGGPGRRLLTVLFSSWIVARRVVTVALKSFTRFTVFCSCSTDSLQLVQPARVSGDIQKQIQIQI